MISYLVLLTTTYARDLYKLMQGKYEMSMMGELSFFLGLQVHHKIDGIFICQSKYIRDLLKKYHLEDSAPAKTPMPTVVKLDQESLVRMLTSRDTEV